MWLVSQPFKGYNRAVLLTPFSFLLVMMLGFSGILALFSLLRLRKSRGAWSFIGILVSISLYLLGFALEQSDIHASRFHYWEGIQKSALLFLPALYVLFVLQSTNVSWIRHPWIRYGILAPPLLAFIPIILQCAPSENALTCWTQAFRKMTVHPYWVTIEFIYSSLFLTIALIRLITRLGATQNAHRAHMVLLLLASTPICLFFWGSDPWLDTPYSSLLLSLTPFLFAYAIFGYRFLYYNPIARELVFDRMQEAVILLDSSHRIVDYNQAATPIFPMLKPVLLGENISLLYNHTPGLEGLLSDSSDHGIELPETPAGHTYEVHVQALKQNGILQGRMIRFNDVSRQVELRHELEHLATTDTLTGAMNRRHLHDSLHHEIKRSLRQKSPLAILFLDIDHFKFINDTYGHGVGDEILKQFALTIRRNLRSTDLFGRYGGEEFILALTDTNEEQAKQVAEKVRKNIAAQRFPHKGKNIMYTISIGIAIFNDFAVTTACCEKIIQQADACLYKAKEWGRNQTVCWTDLNQQWQN